MKVIVLVKATHDSETGLPPSQELIAAMGKFNQELMDAGVFVSAGGLEPSMRGKRVRFRAGNVTQIDGPFAETKELVAGFWIWEVPSMEDALAWVKKAPFPADGDGVVELRQFWC